MGVPSGNSLALYNFLNLQTDLNYDIWWTGQKGGSASYQFDNFRATPERTASIISHISYLIFLMRFKILLFEGAGDLSLYVRFLSNRRDRSKVLLNHGFCLKSSGVLSPSLTSMQREIWRNVGDSFDIFSVTSKLEKYLLSSTYNGAVEKFKVLGPQRFVNQEDFSQEEKIEARKLISGFYDVQFKDSDLIMFYTPTHRDHLKNNERPVLFGFDDLPGLNQLLSGANVFLFVREHGLAVSVNFDGYSNIIYTADRGHIDFHRVAPGINGLITDYSGIFLELLCTDIKFGFWHYDYSEYQASRGFSIADSVFDCGWRIDDQDSFGEFINSARVPSEMRIKRSIWHSNLFENSTQDALKMTSQMINKLIDV